MASRKTEQLGVTKLELFFDLVFVFTVTQLTALLDTELNLIGLAKLVVLLSLLWYMYGGYAWGTNQTPVIQPAPKMLLIAAMAAFLVLALAVPHAFSSEALAFALAYLVVNLVHSTLFLISGDSKVRRGILRVAPTNLGAAILVVVGAFGPNW